MSTSDRELLELAARACGKGPIISNDGRMVILGPNSMQRMWAPLHNDGDAFRLALDLHMSLTSNIIRYEAGTIRLTLSKIFIRECTLTQAEDVAARRAIVRAAAEIGKSMEESK